MATPNNILILNSLDAKRQRIIEYETLLASLEETEKNNLKFPTSEDNILFEQALIKLNESDYKSAINLFSSFEKSAAKSVFARISKYWIARCFFHLGDLNTAIAYFKNIVNEGKSPKYEEALMLIARSLERLSDLIGAYSYYERLLKERADSEYADLAIRRQIQLRSKLQICERNN